MCLLLFVYVLLVFVLVQRYFKLESYESSYKGTYYN